MASNGEMVKTLEIMVGHAENLMHGIVEEAADAGAADACGLRFQVEYLPDDAGFPEQAPIEVRPAFPDGRLEFRNHPKAEGSVSGDILAAADACCSGPDISGRQQEKWQSIGTTAWALPDEPRVHA